MDESQSDIFYNFIMFVSKTNCFYGHANVQTAAVTLVNNQKI